MRDGDTRLRDRGNLEVPVEPVEGPGNTSRASGFRARIKRRAAALFSPRTYLLGTILSLVAILVVPLGGIGNLVGVLLAGFLLGVASDETHYPELALAGGTAGAISSVLNHLVIALLGAGIPLILAGAATSGLAALVGHYFGGDLRRGLTRDITR